MGIRLSLVPHLLPLMNSEDQARYGAVSQTGSCMRDTAHSSPKTSAAERKEHASFANWLLAPEQQGTQDPLFVARHPYPARRPPQARPISGSGLTAGVSG